MFVFDFRVFDSKNKQVHGNEPITDFFSMKEANYNRRSKTGRHYTTLIVIVCYRNRI